MNTATAIRVTPFQKQEVVQDICKGLINRVVIATPSKMVMEAIDLEAAESAELFLTVWDYHVSIQELEDKHFVHVTL